MGKNKQHVLSQRTGEIGFKMAIFQIAEGEVT
jgi:hypothetical protein